MKNDFKEIEKKWQEQWEKAGIYRTEDNSPKPKCYVLDMFPYPSGNSMHVGHPRGYVGTDVYSRYKRMNGFNLLHPMGWDAFGLPAEETAILKKQHPSITVTENIEKFRSQLGLLGLDTDWKREVNTTDPIFYRHTQRLFLEFFRRGLAYNDMVTVNWCEGLGTVLANEDIIDGKSERGGFPVVQRPMRQWVLAITRYADRLVADLDQMPNWPESVKNAQRKWIGKSEGHEIVFPVEGTEGIRVFTSRVDTIFGTTFLAVAPEHPIAAHLAKVASNPEEINGYIEASRAKTEVDRKAAKTKTGVVAKGIAASNPVNGKAVPIVVADYVLISYGTGAIMAVPAHDERDLEFANEFGLENIQVIADDNRMINSGPFDGVPADEARDRIAEYAGADKKTFYKIRDWVFSRQRFWGEPFPIVWVQGEENYTRAAGGALKEWLPPTPVSYTDQQGAQWFALPVLPSYLDAVRLPQVDFYSNSRTGEGPLADMPEWTNAFINLESGEVSNDASDSLPWVPARRETNTMPQWAGSSWYYLRYTDPNNIEEPFSRERADQWLPVDVYAGADHATAHLIYARFWHKVLYDAGLVRDSEPFKRLEFLGYILAPDGSKISKRMGNSRRPEDVIAEVGADAFRLFEMFVGPFEKAVPWKDDGPVGTKRFLERIWQLSISLKEKDAESSRDVVQALHSLIEKTGQDVEAFKFNTAVARMMGFLNLAEREAISKSDFLKFIQLLAPFAPHTTEEIWHQLGGGFSIHTSEWPVYDEQLSRKDEIQMAVQVNGKVRGTIMVKADATADEAREAALAAESVQAHISGKEIRKFIYVPSRIINFVVS